MYINKLKITIVLIVFVFIINLSIPVQASMIDDIWQTGNEFLDRGKDQRSSF